MPETPKDQNVRFLPIFGIALGTSLGLSFVYSLIVSGLSAENWSNALCTSAMFLGFASIIPVFLDAGRGIAMAGKFSAINEEQKASMEKERLKRQKGMTITFALAAATVIIGIISAILSLI